MNYEETINYLFTQLPMYQRVGPVAMKKDLGNIQKLMDSLGNTHTSYPTIHIAGTNGKGSTAHLMAAVLQTSGMKTGLYTSPHYRDFRERIKIDGTYISEEAVIAFVEKNKSLFEEIKPSFFEITVALAFDYFAQQKVDIAVIETGLGGRLDSTNIINPLLSVITNIGYDHQNMLGDTLPEIAGEKAGIIKFRTPVVIGESHPETVSVFIRKALKEQSPIYFAEENTIVTKIMDGTIYTDILEEVVPIELSLLGDFQIKNLNTALTGLLLFFESKETPISDQIKFIQFGVKNIKTLTNMIGRWDILGKSPFIIADSAHNEPGLKAVLSQVKNESYEQLHIVLGVVNDKDLKKILPLFPQEAIYYFAKPDIPRGLDASELQKMASTFGLNGKIYASVNAALDAAKKNVNAEDLIYVGGSTFVVAEVI